MPLIAFDLSLTLLLLISKNLTHFNACRPEYWARVRMINAVIQGQADELSVICQSMSTDANEQSLISTKIIDIANEH
ncbi:hypothetical protein BEL05_01875 [Shewanella colwelliana]|uniref:Uncharacterized protein n=1 Tax=Shewanella colwelliana TaxID=23 RepID=A0A1E5IWE0_SHECO|nr:hypothetical protein BEL05_01875 [Shewanella colwelliana]